jgi:hypothetical protein
MFSDPGDYNPPMSQSVNNKEQEDYDPFTSHIGKSLLPALSTQVGGDHYKSMVIQPIEYITKNNLGWCEGNIVKYITRWKQKGGKADIDKVIHYANLLKELN